MKIKLDFARTKILGSWQRLALSTLILAALLLIGYNGSKLMVLLSPPISGRSTEVKLASQKWQQLQNKISQRSKVFIEDIDLDTALLRTSSNSGSIKHSPVVISSNGEEIVRHVTIKPPIISGILRNTNIHGQAYSLAIIDGHRFKENDRVQGFRIQQIKDDGVVVTRGNQKWFIRAPNVSYSRVHASGSKGNGT